MKAFLIVATTFVCSCVGYVVGAAIGDRKTQYMDFGVPVLFGAGVGVIIGAFVGVIIGAVVFT